MRISDWSSDVCSSDLPRYRQRAGCRGNGGDDRVSRSSRDQSQAIETLGAGHRRRFSHAAHKPFARRFLVAQVLADQRQSHAVGSRVSCTQATDRAGKLQQELYITRIAEILLEDVTNTERTQRGIEAGAYDTMQLQDGEVKHRHNLHQAEIGSATD